jgi:hypothetical protein
MVGKKSPRQELSLAVLGRERKICENAGFVSALDGVVGAMGVGCAAHSSRLCLTHPTEEYHNVLFVV